MSSLAASRADNYYYPKDWSPSRGSINKFHNSHPLGKRAKDLDQGILVVRFEMPFNVWCTTCDTHIGKGVRFNAKKKQVGYYLTTPIWEFDLKCPTCKGKMIVRTDPKNSEYEMVQGIRQKVETWTESPKSYDQELVVADEHTRTKLAQDPFFRLEHQAQDLQKAQAKRGRLEQLIHVQEANTADPFRSNSLLRRKFRQQKKVIHKKERDAAKKGLFIPLVDATTEDREKARNVKFGPKSKRARETQVYQEHELRKLRRVEVASASIFDTSKSTQVSTGQSRNKTTTLRALKKAREYGIDYREFRPHSSITNTRSTSQTQVRIKRKSEKRPSSTK